MKILLAVGVILSGGAALTSAQLRWPLWETLGLYAICVLDGIAYKLRESEGRS